jgi:hypothetical protein
MVVNKLQNGVLNSRKTQSASRLNCQNIFFKYGLILFFSNSDRDFYSMPNIIARFTDQKLK